MAILNFPPTAGEPIDGSFTYSSDGVTYSWDGYKWTADTGSGGGGDANHSDGPTPPPTGELADQWYNTDDGRLYTYTADSSGTLVWIDASPDSIAGGSGGSGDGTTVNYNGASAWGYISSLGEVRGGQNISSNTTRTGPGAYSIKFTTPLSSAEYSITTGGNANMSSGSRTVNGFNVLTFDGDNNPENKAFSFAVHSENAIAPQSGVGADSWASCKDDGTIFASFNVASVTKSATGTYDILFSVPMPGSDYSVQGTSLHGMRYVVTASNQTTQGFTIRTYEANVNALQDNQFTFTVHASSTVTPTYTWTRDGTTLKPANDGDDVDLGNIQLSADGSGSFAQPVVFGNDPLVANNGVRIANSGGIITRRDTGTNNNPCFAALQGGGNTTADSVIRMNFDGSSTFAGNMQIGTIDQSSTTATGVHLNKVGVLKAQRSASSDSNSNIIAAYKGSSVVWSVNGNGASSFTSNVTVPNVIFNLEPDNSVNYTATMVDGEETQVYNGPTLDVKELLLTLQTAATRIATLEAKVATLESDHTTLMNNNNNGGGY